MPHLDEGTIHAWLEGGLPPDEAALTEEHIASCDECSGAVAEARGLIAASSRILTALDNVPSGVIPVHAPRMRRWYVRREFQAAAAVLLVAASSLVLMRGGQKGMAPRAAVMSAATDTQASAAAAPVVSEMAPPAAATREGTTQERPQVATVAPKKAAPTEPARRLLQKAAEPVATREEAKSLAASDAAAAQSAPVQRAPAQPPPPPAAPALGNIADFERSARADSSVRREFLDVFAKPRLVKVERHIGYEPWKIYEVAPGVQLTVMRPSQIALSEVVVTRAGTEPEKRSANAAARQKGARDQKKESPPPARDTVARVLSGVAGAAVGTAPPPAVPQPAPVSAPVAQKALQPAMDSIQWTNSVTGIIYKLVGPLTKAQLESVRTRLPALKD